MKKIQALILGVIMISITAYSQTIKHNLDVDIDIAKKTIDVVDVITIKNFKKISKQLSYFYLNRNLNLEHSDKNIIISKAPDQNKDANHCKYLLKIKDPDADKLQLTFKYSGIVSEEILESEANYGREFNETNGIICDKGIYLAGSSYWYPVFDDLLYDFTLSVSLPSLWHVVSQGSLVMDSDSNNGFHTEKYTCIHPQQEIYLVAAAFTIYEKMAGEVKVQAYLRTADEELANKYLNITSGYIKMYEDMLGSYPYTKFTLTENFWETGYGMPSFTLLGEQVIRLPFILYSSYPHELLHNWWGNSVYVDYKTGNWCEGITVYMADHMLKEQKGQGAEYRRATLQKFTDYVNDSNDFPIVEFRERHNAAEEAIGYGKTLMFNHMLRKKVGDKNFIAAYRKFYNDFKFKDASFNDIRNSFQAFTKEDLKPFFDQWLLRKGAPVIELTEVVNTGNNLQITLSQTQDEDVFVMDIPVAFYFADEVIMKRIKMKNKKVVSDFSFDKPVLKVEVDPQFDVMRILYKSEVPTSLSQLFGSTDAIILIPRESKYTKEYIKLVEAWKKSQAAQGNILNMAFDAEYSIIPNDKAVWILGYENKFANLFDIETKYSNALSKEEMAKVSELRKSGSLVFALSNPRNYTKSIGFVGTNVPEAIPGLTRLLIHYGKYSYLGFEGTRPNNVLKGLFPALSSPLHQYLKIDGKTQTVKVKLESAKALSEA